MDANFYLRTFSDCSCIQPNEHINAHHYENIYENLFQFYIVLGLNNEASRFWLTNNNLIILAKGIYI